MGGSRIRKSLSEADGLQDNLSDSCKLAFMPMDIPQPRGPILIFGEYFMKKFYTVFDRDENVIGLAYANQDGGLNNGIIIETPYEEVAPQSLAIKNKSEEVLFKSEHKTINRDDFLIISP
jgi:hypothetical protein